MHWPEAALGQAQKCAADMVQVVHFQATSAITIALLLPDPCSFITPLCTHRGRQRAAADLGGGDVVGQPVEEGVGNLNSNRVVCRLLPRGAGYRHSRSDGQEKNIKVRHTSSSKQKAEDHHTRGVHLAATPTSTKISFASNNSPAWRRRGSWRRRPRLGCTRPPRRTRLPAMVGQRLATLREGRWHRCPLWGCVGSATPGCSKAGNRPTNVQFDAPCRAWT